METELAPRTRRRSRHADSYVFFEGEIVPYGDAYLPPMTHALHYGTGCFEGIRAYWNSAHKELYLLQGEAHYTRLRRSAAILRLDLPFSTEELIRSTLDLLRRNDARTDTYIRPLVYVSAAEIGVRLHNMETGFLIYTAPLVEYIDTEGGIRCMTSSWRRISDSAIPARAKISGSYVNSAPAKSEALENRYHEAIMLATDGPVSECSAANTCLSPPGVFL